MSTPLAVERFGGWLDRVRGRHIAGLYLVAVVVVNLTGSLRRSERIGRWSFWLIDMPVVVLVGGISVWWLMRCLLERREQ